jgi:hypothetical protein
MLSKPVRHFECRIEELIEVFYKNYNLFLKAVIDGIIPGYNGFHVSKDEIVRIEFRNRGRIRSAKLIIYAFKNKDPFQIQIFDKNTFETLYSMMNEFLPNAVVRE